MLNPVFREPGYGNTSNPYIGRVLKGTQEFVQELEELCGPEDTIISAGGELVQPLMYRRALSYGEEHADMVRNIARWMRAREGLGGILEFAFDRLEIKRQRGNELFTVRALLGSTALRQQLVDERRFIQRQLPPSAEQANIITSRVRIAETPSYAFAATVVERIHAHTGMNGELGEPVMLFTPPYSG